MRRGGHQKPIRIARARVARERPNIRYVGDRLRIALDDLAAGIARNVDLLANKLHGHERRPPIHARLDDLRRANADERRLQRMALALAFSLAAGGVFVPGMIVPTLVALGVSLLGMWLGQLVRDRLSPTTFRRCFFAGLMMLGVYLFVRGIK